MSFLDIAKIRCSVRKFSDKRVEDEKIMEVLEAGRIAPSACNYQPWHFIVLKEEGNKRKMSDVYPREWFFTAPVIIAVCGDHSKSWKRSDNKDHCDIDVAIAVDHMTLAAADLGLGTCWVCAFDKEKCSRLLALPGHIEPIALLPLGYPKGSANPNRHVTQRKSLEEIVHWEAY